MDAMDIRKLSLQKSRHCENLKISKSRSFFGIFIPIFLCGPKITLVQYYLLITHLKNASIFFSRGGG